MNQVTPKGPTGPVTVSKVWDNVAKSNEALKKGVAISFPILAIGTNQWIVRWKGEDTLVTIPNTEYPAPFVDVVILDAQEDMSRVFYASGYVQGVRGKKPDCWSSNGIKPDQEVASPVNPICATCPKSAWGSGGSPAAPKAQACQQRRRTVVVPYHDDADFDLTNEAQGGPMLLSVPPGSLTNQVKYGEYLDDFEMADGTRGPVFFAAVVTRLSYEPKLKYSKVVFSFVKTLNDEESLVIRDLRTSEAVKRILNSKINIDGGEVDQPDAAQASASQVQGPPPKAANPVPSKTPPAPPKPEAPPAPQAPKVGGHPVGISEAVARPTAPPASQRTVATAPPVQEAAPAVDDDAEAKAPLIGGEADVFDDLINGA